MRAWLNAPPAGKGRQAAAFDTRLDKMFAGSAAKRIARGLRQHGYQLVAGPEGFIVEDMAGPLRDGERNLARTWGVNLLRQHVH